MDRNEKRDAEMQDKLKSPPARVAWIETGDALKAIKGGAVATREGGVDRNIIVPQITIDQLVATREGGVDRNRTRRRERH